jgi:hypothetical protein
LTTPIKEHTMARTIGLAAAMMTLVSTAAVVGVVAFDAGRSANEGVTISSSTSPVAVSAQPASYQVAVARKTADDLGRRRGCSPVSADPPRVACNIRTAFPDVGLTGTVTFVGSGTERDLAKALTFGLAP